MTNQEPSREAMERARALVVVEEFDSALGAQYNSITVAGVRRATGAALNKSQQDAETIVEAIARVIDEAVAEERAAWEVHPVALPASGGRVMDISQVKLICPGCGWVGHRRETRVPVRVWRYGREETAYYRQCPKCGYEQPQTLRGLLTNAYENGSGFNDVNMARFLPAFLRVWQETTGQ